MRIVIVDDEMLVRAGLKSAIDWEKHGYQIVGEAENGTAALDIIREVNPDIVLLDVNMPVMNGIEVVKELKMLKTRCKVIILSCHEEFEFAKEALKYGAYDYLLKHKINSDYILNAINELRQVILNEREQEGYFEKLHRKAEFAKDILKKEFLLKLIKGEKFKPWEVNSKIKELDINLTERNICCISFKIDDILNIKKRYDTENKDLLQFSVVNITSEILLGVENCEFVQLDENMFVIILSNLNQNSRKNIYDTQFAIVKRVREALINFLNVYTTFAICDCFTGFNFLAEGFKKTKKLLELKYINYNKYIFTQGELCSEENVKNLKLNVQGIEDNLIKSIVTKDAIDAIKQIERLKNCLVSSAYFEENLLSSFIERFVAEIANVCDMNIETKKTILEQILNECTNLEDTCSFLCNIINDYISKNKLEPSGNYLVREAAKFIKENFQKDLSLELIAVHLGVSESYISRVFNKEMQMSILKYINILRINKAKELLKDHKLKNYEVAEMVGFNTAIHFDIVFKKINGITPSEYRNSLK